MLTRLKSILCPVVLLPACWYSACLAAANDDNFELRIRPSICVSFDSEAPCSMLLNISWTGGNGEPVCLNTRMEEAWLACWSDAMAGETELPHANSGNVVYQLVSMQNNRILADAEVQVISRDLRDTRRRHRHVWSIL